MRKQIFCPDCGESQQKRYSALEINRRTFLKKTGKAALALGATPLITKVAPVFARGSGERAEQLVKRLHDSLTADQQRTVLLPWTDTRRMHVGNNWRVVRPKIRQIYSSDQQEMIDEILKGVTSEEGFDKITRAMRDDAGGLKNYSTALFSDGQDKLSFVLTGRHQTIRADGGAETNAVFGGPLFYGHAVEFNERPDHPGNVWWHQSRLASKVYYALDGKQQKLALLERGSPADSVSSIGLKGQNGDFTGIPGRELSADQKKLLDLVLRSLLEPYRKSDIDEVMTAVNANGGLDNLHIAFYKDGDLPDKDGIWDRWKIEGPAFVWYFRGSPHVHTWINIAHQVDRHS